MPLVYLCVRPEADAARAEHASFRAETGLGDDLDVHDLTRAPLPGDAIDRWSGFVVGGSPFNVSDPESAKSDLQRRVEADLERVAAAAADAETAALFTCYGIGVVTRMLGGEVSRAFPEPTGPATVGLTAHGERDAVTGGLAHTFTALSAHKEGAGAVPPGAVLLATNEACPVQAYRVGERLYATQFHPESTPLSFVERITIYRDGGYFDPAEYDAIADRVRATPVTEPGRMLRAFARLVTEA
ncbi:glutamine amidotransferase-related protein [Microbacterium luticocti]|uniref:glutamine amidotransferase-related protein n=1 Tax=Microbacterium luticocti TaxID=451764 RepID=UPI0004177102|nr:GMP synthase [Microbacterium luticocti]